MYQYIINFMFILNKMLYLFQRYINNLNKSNYFFKKGHKKETNNTINVLIICFLS